MCCRAHPHGREREKDSPQTVAMVPTTATNPPTKMRTQSNTISVLESFSPNNCKCAAAGKITDTAMVQIKPTRAQMKLKDGTNMATAKDVTISTSLMTLAVRSIALSLGRMGATISSIPSARGNIVNVNLEKAVKIISQAEKCGRRDGAS